MEEKEQMEATNALFFMISTLMRREVRRGEGSLKSAEQGNENASHCILVSALGQLTVSTYEQRAAHTTLVNND